MQHSPKKSVKKKAELQQTEYWIAISQDAKRNGVRRYEGPVTEPGHEKEPLHCVATYQPANDKTIQPPVSAAALPEEHGATSAAPAAEELDGDLVNRGIEKAKNGDLDGALSDFDRAIKANPKDDAP